MEQYDRVVIILFKAWREKMEFPIFIAILVVAAMLYVIAGELEKIVEILGKKELNSE